MTLIKCKECGKKISSLAKSCPNCGFPIDNEIKNTKKTKVLFENRSKLLVLLSFIACFTLFIILIDSSKYAYDYDTYYSLLRVFKNNNLLIFIFVYGLLFLIGYILKIATKKTYFVGKLLMYFGSLLFILINFFIIRNNFYLSYFYIIVCVAQLICCVIPIKYNLIERELDIDDEQIESIKKDNEKLEKLYKKKYKKIVDYFIIIIIIILSILSSIYYMSKDNIKNIPLYKITNISQISKDKKIYLRVTNDYINVRNNAGTSNDKIGKVNKDDVYEVVDIVTNGNYKWYKIKDSNNNNIGYVANPYYENYVSLFYVGKDEKPEKSTIELNSDAKEEEKDQSINKDDTTNKKSTNNKSNSTNSSTKKNNTTKLKEKTENNQSENKNETVNQEENSNEQTTKDNEIIIQEEEKEEKKDCSNEIAQRKEKYDNDVESCKEKNSTIIDNAYNDYLDAYDLVEASGGYISESTYNSYSRSYNSQLSTIQVNLQRAMMDSSGSSASKVAKYQNQQKEIISKLAVLSKRNQLSRDCDNYKEMYEYKVKIYKNELEELETEYEKDIETINNNCN